MTMIASAHLATGAVSGLLAIRVHSRFCENIPERHKVPSRLALAFLVGIVSHIIFDAFPHREYALTGSALKYLVGAEILLMHAILLESQDKEGALLIFLGMAGAALPDFLYIGNQYLGWGFFTLLHNLLHLTHGMLVPLYTGFTIQLALVLWSILVVRWKSAS